MICFSRDTVEVFGSLNVRYFGVKVSRENESAANTAACIVDGVHHQHEDNQEPYWAM
jgi:hypothetical protein